MSSSDPDEAWKVFYLEYGPAMFAWQLIEAELATLFSRLTKIPPDMAIQIFYSGTGFNARIDVFSASLTASKADEAIKTLAHGIIAKSKQYSAFRNKFAHDQPLLYQHGQPAKFEIVMAHGKGQFQSDAVKKRYMDAAITVPEIKEAAAAFRDLATFIRDLWAQFPIRRTSIDKLHARLQALPILPRPKAQPPKPAKRNRQRPPSRG
jgi:hypothetical protein